MPATATIDVARAASLFHALSDETRLAIIQLLLSGERCVCDLTDALDAAQSRLSFHMKTLKEAGIVNDRPVGRWIYYSLDQETIEEIAELVDGIRPPARRARSVTCCD